jgi:hypothetical protein
MSLFIIGYQMTNVKGEGETNDKYQISNVKWQALGIKRGVSNVRVYARSLDA